MPLDSSNSRRGSPGGLTAAVCRQPLGAGARGVPGNVPHRRAEVYLGGDVVCSQTLVEADQAGLFVDEGFVTPYQVDPGTREYF